MEVLAGADWQARERAHHERVDRATAEHRRRREDGVAHPVEDFLFRYYPITVGRLRRWHPGAEVALAQAAELDRAGWRHYRLVGDAVTADLAAFAADRRDAVARTHAVLAGTAGREPQFGCLALHEWAMVYRLRQDEVRHPRWPLRLGPAGTDAVVDAHRIRCSHVDAFRFFTEPARPLNQLQPTRQRQAELEQPGCLHANMDLYRYAVALLPVAGSDLVMACFELARDLRTLDMRASPYDVSELGYPPIPVETDAGAAQFVAEQRALAERAVPLRQRLLAVCDLVLARPAEPVDPATAAGRQVSPGPPRGGAAARR